VASAESTDRKAVSNLTPLSRALHTGSSERAIRNRRILRQLTHGPWSRNESQSLLAGGMRSLWGTGLLLFLVWCVRYVKIHEAAHI